MLSTSTIWMLLHPLSSIRKNYTHGNYIAPFITQMVDSDVGFLSAPVMGDSTLLSPEWQTDTIFYPHPLSPSRIPNPRVNHEMYRYNVSLERKSISFGSMLPYSMVWPLHTLGWCIDFISFTRNKIVRCHAPSTWLLIMKIEAIM